MIIPRRRRAARLKFPNFLRGRRKAVQAESYRCLLCLEIGGSHPGPWHDPKCKMFKMPERRIEPSINQAGTRGLWEQFSTLFKQ